jgi:hypothetical protein
MWWSRDGVLFFMFVRAESKKWNAVWSEVVRSAGARCILSLLTLVETNMQDAALQCSVVLPELGSSCFAEHVAEQMDEHADASTTPDRPHEHVDGVSNGPQVSLERSFSSHTTTSRKACLEATKVDLDHRGLNNSN